MAFATKKPERKSWPCCLETGRSTANESRRTVDATPSRVCNLLPKYKQQPLTMREGVKEVCVDMWGGFPKVIREVFPNERTVIDRFYVQKLINKAMDLKILI